MKKKLTKQELYALTPEQNKDTYVTACLEQDMETLGILYSFYVDKTGDAAPDKDQTVLIAMHKLLLHIPQSRLRQKIAAWDYLEANNCSDLFGQPLPDRNVLLHSTSLEVEAVNASSRLN